MPVSGGPLQEKIDYNWARENALLTVVSDAALAAITRAFAANPAQIRSIRMFIPEKQSEHFAVQFINPDDYLTFLPLLLQAGTPE